MRINDHLAEINGRRPRSTSAARSPRSSPGCPRCGDDVRRVAADRRARDRGRGARRDARRSRACEREWVASYWPVRAAGGGALLGVGAVVFDVTDRRAAERAAAHADRPLRDAADRALGGRRGHGRARGRPLRVRQPRRSSSSAATRSRSSPRSSRSSRSSSRTSARRPTERARLRIERDLVDTTYSVAIRRRDGGRVAARAGRRAAARSRARRARQQLVVVVRDVTARRRAEAERERLLGRSALLAEASALFDQSLDEERTLRSVAELCVRDLADTCVIVLGSYPGPARRRDRGRARPGARARAGRRRRCPTGAPATRSPR